MKTFNPLLLLAVLVAAPSFSHAGSALAGAGSGALSAASPLDFRIRVPKMLFLRIGTGALPTAMARVRTVNRITFTVPAAKVGNATPIAATATSGDLANGAVTVRLFANGGNSVTLNSRTTGRMKSSAGDTISWADVLVSSAALPVATAGYANGAITHPTFNDGIAGGPGTATTVIGAGKLVRVESAWTFAYANAVALPAGDYGSSASRNGRVTYSASQP